MTEISFPPLHNLSPSEHETRKQHLLSEIRREPERRRFPLPTIPPLHLRFAVPAVAALGVAALITFLAFPGANSQHSVASHSPHHIALPHHNALAPAAPVPLSKAQSDTSNWFDVPLILPDTSILKLKPARPTVLEQWCASASPGAPAPLCQVDAQFESPALNVAYVLTSHTFGSTYPTALDQYRAEITRATDPSEYQIVSLSDGTPALIETGKTGNSIEFRLGKLSITMWAPDNNGVPTTVDASAIQALAQSMVDQAAR